VPLSAQDVAEIARLLEESDFEELHVEQDGLKLTLRRGSATRRAEDSAAGATAAPRPAMPERPEGAQHDMHSPPPPATRDGALVDVIAPLVGIFYRAPRPGATPYVEVGTAVQADSIVGIIEVMKLMNAVRAEAHGTVAEILVQDGAAVEYGQVLLRVTRGASGG
jgi:acetyl-CoA carboxylase biotin carboxyl carrier protein